MDLEIGGDAGPLDPRSRALDGATGVPVTLSDGNPWMLHDGGLLNRLDDLRDRLDDEARLAGQVGMLDVSEAACMLLSANYDLSRDEIRSLVGGIGEEGHKALADAVMEALFGPENPRRTYTAWAASAFIANGIDPDAVPSSLRRHVLNQLVLTGRAVSEEKYIESAEAGPKLAAIRAKAGIPARGIV